MKTRPVTFTVKLTQEEYEKITKCCEAYNKDEGRWEPHTQMQPEHLLQEIIHDYLDWTYQEYKDAYYIE